MSSDTADQPGFNEIPFAQEVDLKAQRCRGGFVALDQMSVAAVANDRSNSLSSFSHTGDSSGVGCTVMSESMSFL